MSVTDDPTDLATENAALRARVADLEATLERTRDALEDADDTVALLRGEIDRMQNGLAHYRPAEVADAVEAGDTALRAWRNYRGFKTAKAFAEAAGITPNYVNRLERGEPIPITLKQKLAALLDTEPAALDRNN